MNPRPPPDVSDGDKVAALKGLLSLSFPLKFKDCSCPSSFFFLPLLLSSCCSFARQKGGGGKMEEEVGDSTNCSKFLTIFFKKYWIDCVATFSWKCFFCGKAFVWLHLLMQKGGLFSFLPNSFLLDRLVSSSPSASSSLFLSWVATLPLQD